jgi:hypothetical protein
VAAGARHRLQNLSPELTAQVHEVLRLEVRKVGEPTRNEDRTMTYPLEMRGIIPIPTPEEQEEGLALAVGSEPRQGGLQHPCRNFARLGFRLEHPAPR